MPASSIPPICVIQYYDLDSDWITHFIKGEINQTPFLKFTFLQQSKPKSIDQPELAQPQIEKSKNIERRC